METVNSQAPDRTKALEERVERLNKIAAEIRRIQAQTVGAVEAEDALSLVLRRDIQHLVAHLPRAEQQAHAVDLHFPGDDLGLRRKPSQPVRKDPHTQFHRVFPRISRIDSNKAGASGT